MWFDRGQALQVSDDASAAVARQGFAAVPGLIEVVTESGRHGRSIRRKGGVQQERPDRDE